MEKFKITKNNMVILYKAIKTELKGKNYGNIAIVYNEYSEVFRIAQPSEVEYLESVGNVLYTYFVYDMHEDKLTFKEIMNKIFN